jgi:hypothetical protein
MKALDGPLLLKKDDKPFTLHPLEQSSMEHALVASIFKAFVTLVCVQYIWFREVSCSHDERLLHTYSAT